VSLATFTDLKTSIANYLERDDLTATIPDFITLTEARLNRDLRVRVNLVRSTTSTTAGTEFYDLPSDLIELRNITYNTTSDSRALSYLSPEAGTREYGGVVTGFPRAYTNLGKNIKLYPTPDAVYTIGINYFRKLVTLSDSNLTNDILAEFPDLYLFGSCREGAVFLNDTEQLTRFETLYASALANVTEAEDKARYGGTVMTMQVQGDPGRLVRRGT
jgi:hypothetical protein|tara:strand:- start:1816 stop:2466 length:651 start_codon:yes stop_codon:yes gene_type:complete